MHIRYSKEFLSSRFGLAGGALLGVLAAAAVFAPYITAYPPSAYTGDIFHPPSVQYWLGTNEVGQDIWAQLVYGARTSLAVGIGTALAGTLASLLAGGTAALFGGAYERFWLRWIDVMLVMPPVLVIILAAAYLRPNTLWLIILLTLFLWPSGARIVRAETLVLKNRSSFAAARTFGAGWFYLLLTHILPDLGPTLTAVFIQYARRAIFMEAGLSFLGVSDPAIVSWGKMMQQALPFTYLDVWRWWLVPAGVAVSLTIAGLAFSGYALETAFNPRLRTEKR